ncbi:uroporphyrinogen-III C-methyltransferase [Conchiformibius steedae DSM 2580]|uniref:Uroporphyrinogen-III C-methyltransferase n=1 Tax=Conchiformibius steedae DSM 2580 TaxID=1121352 RepID=A0AAE9HTU4_9NEIS|nr:uroporphyrinogen-III C-methyltransferase [Conchiformibius steedae]URD67519.1 uroporphyrinogen-III C-methyltransferase [Conchiformibius steedae DSM 2580]
MSEKQTPETTADALTHGEQNLPQQPGFSQPIIIERKHNSGRGLAVGALTLSVIALGASGFLFVQGQNIFRMQEVKIHQELDKAALGESENARKLATSLEEQKKINELVSKLDVGQRDNRSHLADIQNAYRELLQGRVNWLVDEVEVTLNLAAQQLTLSGNIPVAVTALESIEQRLSRFEQAELLPIKRAVSQDLAVLKQNSGSYADISGMVLKLDALEKAVAGLPLVVDNTLQEKNTQAAPAAESADFWTRTWNKTLHLLQSMVEIRKLDSNDAMLLAPEQIYFVRANLRLRLLDARLALMQHNNESYKSNLVVVENTVKEYFDTASPTTKKWLDDLAQLNAQNLSIVSDDVLKDSLAAVRDYQNQTRTATPVNLKPVDQLPAVVLGTAVAMAEQAAAQTEQHRAASATAQAAEAVESKEKPASEPAKPAAESEAAKTAPAASEVAPAPISETSEKKADNAGKPQTGKQNAAGLAVHAAVFAALAESADAEPVASQQSSQALSNAALAAAPVAALAAAAGSKKPADATAEKAKPTEEDARKARRERERAAEKRAAEQKERRERRRERERANAAKRETREARSEKPARPAKRSEDKPVRKAVSAKPAATGGGEADAQP